MHPLDLPSDLLQALRERVERDQIDVDLTGAPAAVLTTSVHERKRLGRTTRREQRSAVVLCPPWLVWAVADGGDVPAVTACHLSRIELSDYASSPSAALMADHGLIVTVPVVGSPVAPSGSIFIGLGPEADAAVFTAQLAQAVHDAGGITRMPRTS